MLVNLKKTFFKPAVEADFSNLRVRVKLSGTSTPARLYGPDGTLMSERGSATLSANGVMDVWVQSGARFDLEMHHTRGFTYVALQDVDPGATLIPATTLTPITDTTYTLSDADYGDYLRFTNAGTKSVTVPGIATEGEITIANRGTGLLTLVPGSGVTVNAKAGGDLTVANGASIKLKWISATAWDIL